MKSDISDATAIALNKLDNWSESIISMLPNIVVALLIIVIFTILAKFVKRLASRIFIRFSDKTAVNNLISTLIYLAVIGIGLIISLNVMELQRTVTSLLAGAGIIGLALGFAFQDISANLISGVIMAFRKPIEIGDIIETQNHMGEVEQIDLRATVLRTFQGLHVIIPNKEVFQNAVTNYTKTKDRRIDLEVGVSYSDDLEKVKDVAQKAIANLPFLLAEKEVNVFFNEFGDSSINLTVMFWIRYPDQPGYLKARSEAVIAIKKAFDTNDITIPFPIRTLDFGSNGEERISELNLTSSSNS